MPIVVEVLPEAEFDAWYASRVSTEVVRTESFGDTFSHEQLMAKGEEVYGTYCSACHLANGQGIPPAFPAIAGSAVATGSKEEHLRLVIDGVTGTGMQAFGKQLDPVELASVVHYQRHSFGNNAGDISQPEDVINLSGGQ
jgi:cytochrome c oxidase subunit 2